MMIKAPPKNTQIELIVDAQCAVGESLLWQAEQNALLWVDIPAQTLHRWDLAKSVHQTWQAPEMIGCIALKASQAQGALGLIAGMATGVFDVQVAGSNLTATPLAKAPHTADNMRFNDGRCDRQGRLIAGTMRVDQAVGVGNPAVYQYAGGALKTLIPAGFVSPFTTPNGTAFSPDGRTFYLSDSHTSQQHIWVFDYDTATGTPHNRRSFVDMNAYAGRPDGAAIDSDGCYWICATDAGLIHRFTPAGVLDYSVAVPVKKPTICTWGGADLRTLFVASIRPSGINLSDQPLAGGMFAITGLGAQGVEEPRFAH